MGKVGIGNVYPQAKLDVTGDVKISSNLTVNGTSTFAADVIAGTLKLGTATDNVNFTTGVAPSGARLIAVGPVKQLPTTCIAPLAANNFQANRLMVNTSGVSGSTSLNMLDMRNDGSNGFIDYGYDINTYMAFDSTGAHPVPKLKLNSACWGDVEIAKGGGFVSTGNYLEVGSPTRNSSIASNIFASGNRVGQVIKTNHSGPNGSTFYNTKLFVNKAATHALSVFNTDTSAAGVENFVVYGDGRAAFGTNYVPSGYRMAVFGKILSEEVVVELRASWPDYVFKKEYKLLPLAELDKFVKKESHLPEVPSAEQVEQSGIELAKLNTVLLKKVEELTLYVIELNKQVEELKKQSNKK